MNRDDYMKAKALFAASELGDSDEHLFQDGQLHAALRVKVPLVAAPVLAARYAALAAKTGAYFTMNVYLPHATCQLQLLVYMQHDEADCPTCVAAASTGVPSPCNAAEAAAP